MTTNFSIVFGALLRLLGIAGTVLYSVIVLTRYRTDGPRYQLDLELRDPVRSAEHILEWLGVRVLDACIRFARATFNLLVEASAEVGEWFIHRKPALQESARSRFLV